MDGPAPQVEIHASGGGYVLAMANESGLWSDYAQSGNFVEWVLPRGRIRDASAGSFQRFRFMAGEEEDVPARATSVRFYQACIGPYQALRSGPIYLSGPPAGSLHVTVTLPGGRMLAYQFPARVE